jgi:glycosyltransferase involved in cell wall biosynthesis
MKLPTFQELPSPPADKTGWPWVGYSLVPHIDLSKKYPKITIVTPSFNQGAFIEETIRSVLLQGYPNFEYIIIDGGSTDDTLKVIKKYEQWITYWISESDNGQSDAINKGLAKSTGDIFNWLCSDDYLEKDALFNIAQAFEQREANVVCATARLLLTDQTVSYAKTTLVDALEEMIFKAHICQPATFFSMVAVKNMGLLNTQLHYAMDAEWWVKYLLLFGNSGIAEIEATVANYRYHSSSKSVSEVHKFGKDVSEIRFAILKLLRAPSFVLDYFPNANKSTIHINGKNRLNLKKNQKRHLLSFYTQLIIIHLYGLHSKSKLFKVILFDCYLKPIKNLEMYRKLYRLHIYPVFK